MINFTREAVVNKQYEVTLEEFMRNHYSGAMRSSEDNSVVLIYVRNVLNPHCMSYVFDVPYLEGMDVDDDCDVRFMIAKKFEEGDYE